MTKVKMETSLAVTVIELDEENALILAANPLQYVDSKHCNGTIFHRVIPDFTIQGGEFTEDLKQKTTNKPIRNEAGNGLKKDRGTVAMARTNAVDSATSQFFIDLKNNDFLTHQDESSQRFGYAVFGKVTEGMDITGKMAGVETTTKRGMQDVPAYAVTINLAKCDKSDMECK